MLVYRCLNSVERKLFEIDYICCRRGNDCERKMRINTHDYGDLINIDYFDKLKSQRLHYFLFKEDALKYLCLNSKEYNCIAEYDIPEDLVINNIGCGFYVDMPNRFVLETAIPYTDLIKDSDEDAYNIVTKGIFNCHPIIVSRHSQRVMKIRNSLEDIGQHISSSIAIINFDKCILKKEDFKTNDNYNEFVNKNGIDEILSCLNIKKIMQGELFDKFDLSEKKINYELLYEVLKKYGLIKEQKTYHM